MSASDLHKQIIVDLIKNDPSITAHEYAFKYRTNTFVGTIEMFRAEVAKETQSSSGKPKLSRVWKKSQPDGTIIRGYSNPVFWRTFFVTVEDVTGKISRVDIYEKEFTTTIPDLTLRIMTFALTDAVIATGETAVEKIAESKVKELDVLPLKETPRGLVIDYKSFAEMFEKQEQRGKLKKLKNDLENSRRMASYLDAAVAAAGFKFEHPGIRKNSTDFLGIVTHSDIVFRVYIADQMDRERLPFLYVDIHDAGYCNSSQFCGILYFDDDTDEKIVNDFFLACAGEVPTVLAGKEINRALLHPFAGKSDKRTKPIVQAPKEPKATKSKAPVKKAEPRVQVLLAAISSDKYVFEQDYAQSAWFGGSLRSPNAGIHAKECIAELARSNGAVKENMFPLIWERTEADGSKSFGYAGTLPRLFYVVRETQDVVTRIEVWTHDFTFTDVGQDLTVKGDPKHLMHFYAVKVVDGKYVVTPPPVAHWDRSFFRQNFREIA
jgi:hypothetical protein